jgi:hypothetical protein
MSDNAIKFTDEQMEALKGLNTKYQQIQSEFGALEVRSIVLARETEAILVRKDALEALYIENTETEKKLVKELTDQYGPGTLNPETGEFTPSVQ